MEKPNILFIVVDCLRFDILEKNINQLKNFKRLKEKSLYFTNAFSTCSTTTPSFASILTGQYPFNHGIRTHHGHRINPNSKTLAQILSKQRYNTHAEVTGPLYLNVGLNKGFDEYNHRSRVDTIYTSKGREIINKIKNLEEPWFFFLHLWTLHKPRWVLKKYDKKRYGKSIYERALKSLDDKLGEILATINENTMIILTGDHGENFKKNEGLKDINKINNYCSELKKKILRLKSAGITFSNRFLDFIGIKQTRKKLGHGYHIYDKLTNVPLFLNLPNKKHKESKILCSHVDILPTILDILEIKENKDFDGKSLLGHLKKKEIHDAIYFEAVGGIFSEDILVGIRTKKYRYCYQLNNDEKEELYDLEKDPYEKKNIIKENLSTKEKLKKKINQITKNKARDFSKGEKISSQEEKKIKKKLKKLGYF